MEDQILLPTRDLPRSVSQLNANAIAEASYARGFRLSLRGPIGETSPTQEGGSSHILGAPA